MADFDINDPSFSEILPSALTVNDKFLADGRSLRLFVIALKMLDRQYHTGSQLAATISDLTNAINTNPNVNNNTTNRHSHANKALLDTYAQTESNLAAAVTNSHSHANKAVLDGITSQGSGTIITAAQIAQVLRFSRSETKQSLSGGTPTLNCDNGYNADFPMTVNAVINITNAPAGVISGGYVILRDTNSYTLTMTLAGSSANVAKMVGAEDLPAGASDTAVLTWIYDGTYLTYNIGKRTEA